MPVNHAAKEIEMRRGGRVRSDVLPVQGQADRWAMFYHGRNMLKNGSRVLMMDELRWDSDGWPTIGRSCPSHTTLPVP